MTASPASVDRLERFLHHLFTELEAAKYAVEISDQALTVTLDKDNVRIEITEERRRHKYVPTQQEIEALERTRERSRKSNWENWPDPLPQYFYEHTGKVTFDLVGWARGLRGKWADGRTQSLESLFDDIVSGIVLRLEFEKTEREEDEERQRRRAKLAQRRELAARRTAREEKRIELLKSLSRSKREASEIRELLKQLPDGDPSPSYNRMIEWAHRRLRELEHQCGMDALVSAIDQDELFPEQDSLFDPEGEPPAKTNYWDD